MRKSLLTAAMLAATMGLSAQVSAQSTNPARDGEAVKRPPAASPHTPGDKGAAGGAVGGAAAGAIGGAIVGGPVGAAVGGAAGAVGGAVTGSIAANLSAEDRTYMREYVVRREVPSTRFESDIVVGAEVPDTVRYYRIEDNPRFSGYRYTRVNNHYVLVDSGNRIVEVIR